MNSLRCTLNEMFILSLILTSFLEIYLFLQIGHWIGISNALIAVLITGMVGFCVLKTQGKNLLKQFSLQLKRKTIPAHALFCEFLLLVGGFFLVIPGFLTDTLGFFLFFPQVRSFCAVAVKSFIIKRFKLNRIQFQTYKGVNEQDFNSTWMTYGLNFYQPWKRKSEPSFKRKSSSSNVSNHISGDKSKVFADVIDLTSRRKSEQTE